MGNVIRFPDGASTIETSLLRNFDARLHSPATKGYSAPDADQVSLSRMYHTIKSREMAARLHSLELQVSQKSYFIPAEEVSGSIIDNCLIAA